VFWLHRQNINASYYATYIATSFLIIQAMKKSCLYIPPVEKAVKVVDRFLPNLDRFLVRSRNLVSKLLVYIRRVLVSVFDGQMTGVSATFADTSQLYGSNTRLISTSNFETRFLLRTKNRSRFGKKRSTTLTAFSTGGIYRQLFFVA
jgi:hypothetical protein